MNAFFTSQNFRSLLLPIVVLVGILGFRSWYFTPNYDEGEVAANFSGDLLGGARFELSDLRGSYVLLDFWGSWCGPCRREAPALKAIHEEVGDRLNIVSVAIERSSQNWQKAIQQDERNWPYHLMEQTESTRFLSGPISDLYGVNQLPTHFLIDPEGMVVGVNMGWNEIMSAVE
ncbi:MAG: TlpA disulfide reductase family protein [Bacteroidota bacterium]